jgi:hypothetical protein
MVACLMVTVMLGGCQSAHDFLGLDGRAGTVAPQPGPSVADRGSPVAADAAQVLDSAPPGARLDFRRPDGRPAAVVLGGVHQSGLQVPCRIGRAGAGTGRGDGPAAYAFCRQGEQWYAMPPVVVSGY